MLSPPSISQLLYCPRPPVDAVHGVPGDADGAFVLAALTDDTRDERDKLGEIAPVEFEFLDLFAGNRAADFGGLSINLRDVFTGDEDFLGNGADGETYIKAGLLRDFEDNAFGFELLEAFRGDGDVVSSRRQSGGDVDAVTVGLRGTREIASHVGKDDLCSDHGGAGLICDCAADETVGLRAGQGGKKQEGQQGEACHKRWATRQF